MNKLLDLLSCRTHGLVTGRNGDNTCHNLDQILAMSGRDWPGFGAVSFSELIVALVRIGVPLAQIEQSELWKTAGYNWRERARNQLPDASAPDKEIQP